MAQANGCCDGSSVVTWSLPDSKRYGAHLGYIWAEIGYHLYGLHMGHHMGPVFCLHMRAAHGPSGFGVGYIWAMRHHSHTNPI